MTPYVAETKGAEVDPINLFLPALYDIFWSLVPFVLLIIFFWKFALPKLNTILADRASVIEGGIAKAENAQAEAAAALEEYNKLLSDGRSEAAQIREQARQDGAKILAELKEHASGEADRILSNAQLQIEAERQAALVSLRGEVGNLALNLAGGVLGETLTDEKKANSVVDRFITELNHQEQK